MAGQGFEREFRLLHLSSGSTDAGILRDGAAVPSSTVGTIDDITARKQLDQDQHAHDQLTRRILESSADCIKIQDLNGRLLLMSPGGQQALGITDIRPRTGKGESTGRACEPREEFVPGERKP